MGKHLYKVLAYFTFFSYSPTEREIYTFFPARITKNDLRALLSNECKKQKIVRLPKNKYFRASESPILNLNLILEFPRYTLPQYSIATPGRHSRKGGNPDYKFQHKNSNHRLDPLLRGDDNTRRVQTYIELLKCLPLVRFVGVTGKSAVEGVKSNDDIDLFIITKNRQIWTTRFFVVLFAKLLGIHGGTGVCLNLFFDEQDLVIPQKKQNKYIAHELLQMKPIVDKGNKYTGLLEANRWIFDIFPNARRQKLEVRSKNSDTFCLLSSVFLLLELLMRLIQFPIIKKNKTSFLITPTQLWLFKRDFEIKLKRKGARKVL